MDYVKLTQAIDEAIVRHPEDFKPYQDTFEIIREWEGVDRKAALAFSHTFREKVLKGMGIVNEVGEVKDLMDFDGLNYRLLLLGAPYFFDDYLQAVEYGKPLDKKFYQPRRHYLKRYVDAYQMILDKELDFLSISMPKRTGKSQLGINFTCMLSGRFPDRATLMEGTGDDLVKSFYEGCLEYRHGGEDLR